MNMTETSLKCARHPKKETNLRCGRCDTPICPECAVYTPVGARCPDCGQMRTGLFKPSALQLLFAGIAALVAGIAGGLIIGTLDLRFYSLILAVPYGCAAGEMVLRVCGRKRGRPLEILTGVLIAIGAIGGRVVIAYMVMRGHPWFDKTYLDLLKEAFTPFPYCPVALALVISGAVSRIRYL